MGRYTNAAYKRHRYEAARKAGMCGHCFVEKATKGVLCEGCWKVNTERNRHAVPRKTSRRWGPRARAAWSWPT